MNVDTRNGLIAVIATAAMALVVVGSLIGIIILSVTHDGALSAEALDTFKQILLGGAISGTILGGLERVTSAVTAGKAISAGASVQGSPVSVSSVPAPLDAAESSPGGMSVAGGVSGEGV